MVILTIAEGGVLEQYRSQVRTWAEELYTQLRVQGRTAYLSQGPGVAAAGSPSLQSLGLWALMATGLYPQDPLLGKLAAYVAGAGHGSGPRSFNAYYGFTCQHALYRLLALAYYDDRVGSTQPRLDLSIMVGPTARVVAHRFFDRPGLPPSEFHGRPEDLADGPQGAVSLNFQAVGTGEASVFVSLAFVPNLTYPHPLYFGLFVEKSLALVHPAGHLVQYVPGAPLRPGQLMRVTIQVLTVDSIPDAVVVEDLLPGGLEAVDPNLKGNSNSARFGQMRVRGSVAHYSPRLWYPHSPERWAFPEIQVKKDMVTFRAEYLDPGSHTCSYDAVVVTSGQFHTPPAKAYQVQQPELMGLSSSRPLTVADRE
uniref:Bacterial alpha-2-macroglobulin MG10 domain-containing protein n=1 Tax=Eutreptiella gymnastica TaxID=73025 RepID=A0A7S1J1X5_9EUGL|mmetsp:Transcript_60661/g.108186  ORF Transcript_60661/g.108186 Transcript_60661/m.108186 type:complete len:367 (+) Transcript_60661:596-1696(+)